VAKIGSCSKALRSFAGVQRQMVDLAFEGTIQQLSVIGSTIGGQWSVTSVPPLDFI
jgi:hypothetical protein